MYCAVPILFDDGGFPNVNVEVPSGGSYFDANFPDWMMRAGYPKTSNEGSTRGPTSIWTQADEAVQTVINVLWSFPTISPLPFVATGLSPHLAATLNGNTSEVGSINFAIQGTGTPTVAASVTFLQDSGMKWGTSQTITPTVESVAGAFTKNTRYQLKVADLFPGWANDVSLNIVSTIADTFGILLRLTVTADTTKLLLGFGPARLNICGISESKQDV